MATRIVKIREAKTHLSRLPRRGLLDSAYAELAVTSEHAIAVDGLPLLHKDLFDRLLVAQALVEGITLLTRTILTCSTRPRFAASSTRFHRRPIHGRCRAA